VNLGTLCAAAGAGLRLPAKGREVEITDLCARVQDTVPGALFACVRGARVDGHDLAPEAAERGGAALLVQHRVPVALPQVTTSDVRAALGPLADAFFGHPSHELAVVGLTGTNGKTTTAHLVRGILEAAGRPCGLLGTVETRVGGRSGRMPLTTPEAVDLQRAFRRMLDAGDQACAMEASSIAISQGRTAATRFAAVGFTNLSQDHLDFHSDMEEYFAAKASLFDGRFPRAVSADDPWAARLGAELRFGVSPVADVRAEAFALRPDGTTLTLTTPRGALELQSSLRGRFNVDNVLCAVTLALLLDVPDEAIVAGVAGAEGVPGRFEAVDAGQPFAVIVDYAHTPAGLAAVLRSARPMGTGRVLCVVGAGGDRDRAKRPLMAAAAEEGADRLFLTSDNPRSEDPEAILDEMRAGLTRPEDALVDPDRRAAMARALAEARPGDVVVICGKGHEQGQEANGRVQPFDDRTVARELLGAPA
jgi:UDP-N-acetylmuramoyl-L-alanyl-D-glutamate--2,6-diaminopimelate ligase